MVIQPVRFAPIGMGYVIQVNRVTAVLPIGMKTGDRILSKAKDSGMYIDASRGRPFRSMLVLGDGFVVTTAINPLTLMKRFNTEYQEDYTEDKAIEEDLTDIVFDPEDMDGVEQ